jgi:hypothetical protein
MDPKIAVQFVSMDASIATRDRWFSTLRVESICLERDVNHS